MKVLALGIALIMSCLLGNTHVQNLGNVHATAYINETVEDKESKKDVENSDFIVDTNVGICGIVTSTGNVPIEVKVANYGKDFSGRVRVVVPEIYDYASSAYSANIVLPSGGNKAVKFYIGNVRAEYIRVELVNEKGKILYSKRIDIRTYLMKDGESLVGVLSDNYNNLLYFDGLNVQKNYDTITTRLVELDRDSFPDNVYELSCCDYVIISNYNTSNLSKEQLEALQGYVHQGGVLIIGTGVKASAALSGIQDTLFPYQPGNVEKIDIYVDESDLVSVDAVEYVNCPWDNLSNNIGIGDGIYGTRISQSGAVVVAGYDLSAGAISNWGYRRDYAVTLLEGINTAYSIYTGDYGNRYDCWYMEDAIGYANNKKMPNPFVYGAIYFIYILAIGPVAYLMLKAKKKQEKIWTLIPIMSVIFTVIIGATSMAYTIVKPFVNSFSIMEYTGGTIDTYCYASVYQTRGNKEGIHLSPNFQEIKNAEPGNYEDIGLTNYELEVYNHGEGSDILFNNQKALQGNRVNMMGTQGAEGKDILLNLEVSNYTELSGTVTNNTGYDLQDVVVCYGNTYYHYNYVKNGETVSLEQGYSMSGINNYNLSSWIKETKENSEYGNKRQLRQVESAYQTIYQNAYQMGADEGMVFGYMANKEPDVLRDNRADDYNYSVAVKYFRIGQGQYVGDLYSYILEEYNDPDPIPDFQYDGISKGMYDTYLDGYTQDGELYMEVAYEVQLDAIQDPVLIIDSGDGDTLGEEDTDEYDQFVMDEQMYTGNGKPYIYLLNVAGDYDLVYSPQDRGLVKVALAPYLRDGQRLYMRFEGEPDDGGWQNYYAPTMLIVGGEEAW